MKTLWGILESSLLLGEIRFHWSQQTMTDWCVAVHFREELHRHFFATAPSLAVECLGVNPTDTEVVLL